MVVLRRGRFGIIGIEIDEVADFDDGVRFYRKQDGVRVAVAPAEGVGHGKAPEEKGKAERGSDK